MRPTRNSARGYEKPKNILHESFSDFFWLLLLSVRAVPYVDIVYVRLIYRDTCGGVGRYINQLRRGGCGDVFW